MTAKKPVFPKIGAIRRMFAMLEVAPFEVAILLGFALLYALLEGFGLGLLYPVLQYVEAGGDTTALRDTGGIWGVLVSATDSLGIPLTLATLLVLSFLPVLARGIVYWFNAWFTAVIMNRAVVRLRDRGFRALMYADLTYLTLEGHGTLLNVLTSQVYRGSGAMLAFLQLVAISVLVVVYLSFLLFLSPVLTLLAGVSLVLISLAVRNSIRRTKRYGVELTELGNVTVTAMDERLRAIRLIKMRGQERHESDTVTSLSTELAGVNVRIARAKAWLETFMDPALMLAVFVIVYLGVESLGMTLADLGLFMFILLRLNAKSKEFNSYRQQLSAVIDGLLHTHQVIKAATESRRIVSGKREFPGMTEALVFDDVSFRYSDAAKLDQPVLDHVTLEMPAGSFVALVGKSGAGKSTLADLIPRLRDATEGSVLIDGTAVTEFELHSLRRRVGFMTQDAIMFNDTIRNNLQYGLDRTTTDDDLRAVLEASYSAEFVDKLRGGLETRMGERGVRFSGGQRQRLALARVLLQDPDILILDEPTSALDSESEAYIQQALDALRGVKTLVVIAHRLSTVKRADQIFVMQGGRIVQRGKHEELFEQGGHYRQLFELQMQSDVAS